MLSNQREQKQQYTNKHANNEFLNVECCTYVCTKKQNNSRLGWIGGDHSPVSGWGHTWAVGVAMATGAGRGFNLGVVLTKACCHCDTLSLFSQQRLCYSLCCAINTFCFLYNTVWRNWFPFLISLWPFEDFHSETRGECLCWWTEVDWEGILENADSLLSEQSFVSSFISCQPFKSLPHIDKTKSACPKTMRFGKNYRCPHWMCLFS